MIPRSRSLTLAVVMAGAVLGWAAAGRWERRSRRDLFHARPLRRLAALGWLERQPGAETVGLLRDYLAWERAPLLRRRASALLRRFEVIVR